MAWKTIERPGYLGKNRDATFEKYDREYGQENWRIAWKWGKSVIDYGIACQIYEDGYYTDSFRREDLWLELISEAKNVYDYSKEDTKSGLDYIVQEGPATHIQDIAIRRVVLKRGWEFKGKKLIQIRSQSKYWGEKLSPGKVLFHLPELIVVPHLEGWWDFNSIEDFYQSNKILQTKK